MPGSARLSTTWGRIEGIAYGDPSGVLNTSVVWKTQDITWRLYNATVRITDGEMDNWGDGQQLHHSPAVALSLFNQLRALSGESKMRRNSDAFPGRSQVRWRPSFCYDFMIFFISKTKKKQDCSPLDFPIIQLQNFKLYSERIQSIILSRMLYAI